MTIIEDLAYIKEQWPEMRIGQILCNAYALHTGKFSSQSDPFYWTDDDVAAALEALRKVIKLVEENPL